MQTRNTRSSTSQPIANPPKTPLKNSANHPDPQAPAKPTPMVSKVATTVPYTSGHFLRDERMVALADEVQDHILGPMPLNLFLNTFMGRQRNYVSKQKKEKMREKIEEMAFCRRESQMYPIFIDAVKDICPNFPPVDTHSTSFTDFDNMVVKPDICFYDKVWLEADRMGISTVELIAEVKININDDAFIDDHAVEPSNTIYPPPDDTIEDHEPIENPAMFREADYDRGEECKDSEPGETENEDEEDDDHNNNEEVENKNRRQFQSDIRKLTRQGKDTLGQITTYLTAQKSSQYRTYVFSMLVFPRHARLLYWDNSAVVVTERFLLTNPDFAEFLGRYNKASAAQRGYDTTSRLLTQEELKAVRNACVFDQDARLVKLSTTLNGDFYVAEQMNYMGTSPFGRSTRGCIAYSLTDLKKKKNRAKKVFLKDTWRVLGRDTEHSLYETLHEKQVPYIATVLRTFEIVDQVTKVPDLCKNAKKWAVSPPSGLRKFQHYRLLLNEVGTPLTQFSSTKELVSIMHQALQAHAMAYHKAHILHRDISVGNIMIGEPDAQGKRQALLVDWDMAKRKDEPSAALERTGTWIFIAARLLQDPSLPHELEDDLESFVYLLAWITLRYTAVAFSSAALYAVIDSIFEHGYQEESGVKVGGEHKISFLKTPDVLKRAALKNKPLASLLRSIKDVVAVRYEDDPSTVEEDPFRPGPAATPDDVSKYLAKKKDLTSDWMIRAFDIALNMDNWPTDDAAEENPMPRRDVKRRQKRPSDIDNLAVELPPAKRVKKGRMSDISERSETSETSER